MDSAAEWVEPPTGKADGRMERPGPCAECKRLRQQAQSAGVLHDWDWLEKVRTAQRKHRAKSHGQDARESLPAEVQRFRRPPVGFSDSLLRCPPFRSGEAS
jgi:hypothetical protein